MMNKISASNLKNEIADVQERFQQLQGSRSA